MTVELDVATHLVATLGAPYVLGTNIRTGPVRKATENQAITGAVPSQCVFVLGTGGLDDVPFIDGGALTAEARYSLQVWVRGEPIDYDAGKALADLVFAALDKNPPAGYHECRALSSAPLYVRLDETDHHEWSINVLLRKSVGV